MTRELLKELAMQEWGLTLSKLTLTDVILYCRGPSLEKSTTIDMDKLIGWLETNIPNLLHIKEMENERNTDRGRNVNKSLDTITQLNKS